MAVSIQEAVHVERSVRRQSGEGVVGRAACCIVGAGPGGAVLALLLARQGVQVVLLEARADFERDFRGDVIHPSTLELMDSIQLIDQVLQIPHAPIGVMPMHTRKGVAPWGAMPLLKSKYPQSLQLSQAHLIELLVREAKRYPCFRVVLGARVEALLEVDGRVVGVQYRTTCGVQSLQCDLVIGADGRFSKVRQLAGIEPVGTAQPIDYLWFRLPRVESDAADARGVYVGDGKVVVVLNRGPEWQISYWLPKGSYSQLRADGLDALRQSIVSLVPWLADRIDHLRTWEQAPVLSVESSRVRRWYRPGLMLIGDAAHVMLPVGGVGINMAIQDAIATANVVGPRLLRGEVRERDLAAVQRRREWPTRLVQTVQDHMQRQMLKAGECDWAGPLRVPILWRIAQHLSPVRSLRMRLLAYGGFAPERLRKA